VEENLSGERFNPPAPLVFLLLRLQREALFLAGGVKLKRKAQRKLTHKERLSAA
jgi:hypothetical protein